MFSLKINDLLVLASKFFAAADREVVLAAIPEGTGRVVFVDTGVARPPFLGHFIRSYFGHFSCAPGTLPVPVDTFRETRRDSS